MERGLMAIAPTDHVAYVNDSVWGKGRVVTSNKLAYMSHDLTITQARLFWATLLALDGKKVYDEPPTVVFTMKRFSKYCSPANDTRAAVRKALNGTILAGFSIRQDNPCTGVLYRVRGFRIFEEGELLDDGTVRVTLHKEIMPFVQGLGKGNGYLKAAIAAITGLCSTTAVKLFNLLIAEQYKAKRTGKNPVIPGTEIRIMNNSPGSSMSSGKGLEKLNRAVNEVNGTECGIIIKDHFLIIEGGKAVAVEFVVDYSKHDAMLSLKKDKKGEKKKEQKQPLEITRELDQSMAARALRNLKLQGELYDTEELAKTTIMALLAALDEGGHAEVISVREDALRGKDAERAVGEVLHRHYAQGSYIKRHTRSWLDDDGGRVTRTVMEMYLVELG